MNDYARRGLWAITPLIALLCFLVAVASGFLSPEWALAADGNRYAANVVLAIATICSQLVVFVNLGFYIHDTRPARMNESAGAPLSSALPKGEIGSTLHTVLYLCWFAIGVYFAYAAMTLFGLGRQHYWLFSLGTFFVASRLVTIALFVIFALVDWTLAMTWKGVLAQGEDALGVARRSYELALSSVWLIDVPAIAVTASSWFFVHFLGASEFVAKVAELDYISGRVWVALRNDQVELFVNGIDTGVVVATMLLSQITFSWLMWRYGTDSNSRATKEHPLSWQ